MEKNEYELMVDIAENAMSEFANGDDCGAILELKRIKNQLEKGKRVSPNVRESYERMISSLRQGGIKDLNIHHVEGFKFAVQRFLLHKK